MTLYLALRRIAKKSVIFSGLFPGLFDFFFSSLDSTIALAYMAQKKSRLAKWVTPVGGSSCADVGISVELPEASWDWQRTDPFR